jgi:hypothetical protein
MDYKYISQNTLEYLTSRPSCSPYDIYKKLKEFSNSAFYGKGSLTLKDQYSIIKMFIDSEPEIDTSDKKALNELLKIDYFSSNRWGGIPEILNRTVPHGFKEKCFQFLSEKSNIERYLPGNIDIPPKEILKNVHFEILEIDPSSHISSEKIIFKITPVLFDYSRQDTVDGHFWYSPVEMGI